MSDFIKVKFRVDSQEKLYEILGKYAPASNDNKNVELCAEFHLTQKDFDSLATSSFGKDLVSFTCHPKVYDDVNWTPLDTTEAAFPSLKTIDLHSQPVKAIHFTKECYPVLERITIEQCSALPFDYWNLDLPSLKGLSFEFVHVLDCDGFGPSLNKSPKLEYFISYKLHGLGSRREHTLVLPNCEIFNIYRSDDIRGLKMWAPKLEELNVRACYCLSKITMLKRRPKGFIGEEYERKAKQMSKFRVNVINSGLEPSYFDDWERVTKVYGHDDEGVDWYF